MKKFMNYDFNIDTIALACYVHPGDKMKFQKNRPNHGLALHFGEKKEYIFPNNVRLVVNPYDIIFLPKGSDYEIGANIAGDCYAINFDTYQKDKDFMPFVIKTKNKALFIEHFHTAKNIWETKKNGYMMKCKAELYNIIYSMQQEYFSEYFPNNKLKIIMPAVEYIHENYANELLNVDFLAKICNVTPEYFRRIFKSFYGTSPINYINNLKITRAKELLKSQMCSVTEAAFQSGYTDISHFSREFKKATGVCPSEYK